MADPYLQKGGGGGGRPDPEIRGGGLVPKEFFFGPSAWSKNKRWGRAPQAPALDPSLGSEVKSQPEESGKWVREKWC